MVAGKTRWGAARRIKRSWVMMARRAEIVQQVREPLFRTLKAFRYERRQARHARRAASRAVRNRACLPRAACAMNHRLAIATAEAAGITNRIRKHRARRAIAVLLE